MTTYVDLRFRGIGRIKKAYGTEHKPTKKALKAMLGGLFNGGRRLRNRDRMLTIRSGA